MPPHGSIDITKKPPHLEPLEGHPDSWSDRHRSWCCDPCPQPGLACACSDFFSVFGDPGYDPWIFEILAWGPLRKKKKEWMFLFYILNHFDTYPQSISKLSKGLCTSEHGSKESSHIGCGLRGRRSAPEVSYDNSYNCELDVNLVLDFGCFWVFAGFWNVFPLFFLERGCPKIWWYRPFSEISKISTVFCHLA